MKTKNILIEIIDQLENYENACIANNSEISTSDFLEFLYLQDQLSEKNSKRQALSGGHDDWRLDTSTKAEMNTDISILVVLLYRYAKGYIKKALASSDLKNGDDFSFLITLMTHESLTKIELTKLLVMEKTSGNEIINRLVNHGFIEQMPDKDDRRSIRIRITDFGRSEVIKILPEMQLVSRIVTGNLNQNEIRTLSYLLRKLDDYHNDIFLNKKEFGLKEVLASQNSG
ncbi:MAG: MarR family transcriptional regulator [Bacteroidia bacterium]|nr:MarR family transcriptional regulator [Bacteroidia bacterium]